MLPVPVTELQVGAAPPPPAVVWHLPHAPKATVFAVLAALAVLPQNGAVAAAPVPDVQLVPEHWYKWNGKGKY